MMADRSKVAQDNSGVELLEECETKVKEIVEKLYNPREYKFA
jgi:hypothetical protein